MKEQLRRLFACVLLDLDVGEAMVPAIEDLRAVLGDGLGDGRRLLVIGLGKSARAMAEALTAGLPDKQMRGLVVLPAPDEAPLPPFEVIAAGHPIPDAGSLRAGARALELAHSAGRDEVVVFLVSGGGSALLEAPIDAAVTLEEVRTLYRALAGSGADIVAVNTVRKHLSAVKGGRLALAAAFACRHETIAVIDVPMRPGAAVASGPSTVDPSTIEECCSVLDTFGLWSAVPGHLRERLRRGDLPAGLTCATPWSVPTGYTVISSEHGSRACACLHLAHLGLLAVADTAVDDWPYESAAEHLLHRLDRLHRRHAGRAVAIVTSGELSVPLPPSPGIGGRNQQFALACARRIRGRPITVLSCGTDGIDGNSPAAGAVVDGTTVARARALGLSVHDALRRCDAFPLLHALGDTVITGPTGTNVRDLRVLVHTR